MPDRDDEARLRILSAYERARSLDPSLTQGEYMRRVAPSRFKSESAASRFVTRLRRGEVDDEAARIVEEDRKNTRPSLFRAMVRLEDGRWVSQNLAVTDARGALDAPSVEAEMRQPKNIADLQKSLARYKSKYNVAEMNFDPSSLRVEAMQHQNQPIRMRLDLRPKKS